MTVSAKPVAVTTILINDVFSFFFFFDCSGLIFFRLSCGKLVFVSVSNSSPSIIGLDLASLLLEFS